MMLAVPFTWTFPPTALEDGKGGNLFVTPIGANTGHASLIKSSIHCTLCSQGLLNRPASLKKREERGKESLGVSTTGTTSTNHLHTHRISLYTTFKSNKLYTNLQPQFVKKTFNNQLRVWRWWMMTMHWCTK